MGGRDGWERRKRLRGRSNSRLPCKECFLHCFSFPFFFYYETFIFCSSSAEQSSKRLKVILIKKRGANYNNGKKLQRSVVHVLCNVQSLVGSKAQFVLSFNHLRARQLSRSTLHRRTIRTIASAIAAIERQKRDKLSIKIRLMNRYNVGCLVGLSRVSLISTKA